MHSGSSPVNAAPTSRSLVSTRILALIPCGIALNLVLGTVAHTLKVPLYLDAVGTIAVTLIAGLRAGLIVGVTSFLLGGVLTNPVLPWFSGTQAAIAIYTYLVGKHGWFTVQLRAEGQNGVWRWLITNVRPVLAGIGLGITAGIVSAPVIVLVFGGVTGSGPSLIVAFLLKSGETILKAVLMSGLASEPLDKTVQVLLALVLIRALPNSLKASFGGGLLERNKLITEGIRT